MPPDFERDVRCVLGLPFDAITLRGAEAKIRASIRRRSRCILVTPNLDFVVGCLTDRAFRDSVLRSDLSVVDGWPIIAVARLLGIPLLERVAGSDLFERLQSGPLEAAISVYFFGGPDGAAKAACERLNAERGGTTCVGAESPGFGTVVAMSTDAHLSRLNAARPDFVVVALGAKKGQAWIDHNAARIHAPVLSHLGAVVNFTARTVARAPRWLRMVGLEWAWRIAQEPALWRRYAADARALLRLLATRVLPNAIYVWTRQPTTDALARARASHQVEKGFTLVRLEGAWTFANLAPVRALLQSAEVLERSLEWDLSAATYLDSAAIGLLTLLYGSNRLSGLGWKVTAASRAARQFLRWSCAEYLLDTVEIDRTLEPPQ